MTDETANEIRIERRIAAPRADVYRHLTDSVRWARWQGQSAEVEPLPGGRFRLEMANGATAEGRFIELVPDQRVTFSWGWRGSPTVPPGSSTVDIELVPDGEGTLVRLTHRGLPAEERTIHLMGWEMYLPRLGVAATGGDPGPEPVPA
jgi:uncharacterized protein YndB with AHSA1/START domain